MSEQTPPDKSPQTIMWKTNIGQNLQYAGYFDVAGEALVGLVYC